MNTNAIAKRIFARLGYAVRRIKDDGDPLTAGASMKHLATMGLGLNTVIDIGASDGRFTVQMMRYLPTPHYFLIEAQPIHEPSLKALSATHHNVDYLLSAAGDERGQIFFDAADPFGGQASNSPFETDCLTVPVTTVDHEVQTRNLQGPFLLKLDTHGFEPEILKGSQSALRETDAIIMECYNFRIAPGALLFYEMCEYLSTLGFRCVHLHDPIHRDFDGAFWQMDLVFVRDDRATFSYGDFS